MLEPRSRGAGDGEIPESPCSARAGRADGGGGRHRLEFGHTASSEWAAGWSRALRADLREYYDHEPMPAELAPRQPDTARRRSNHDRWPQDHARPGAALAAAWRSRAIAGSANTTPGYAQSQRRPARKRTSMRSRRSSSRMPTRCGSSWPRSSARRSRRRRRSRSCSTRRISCRLCRSRSRFNRCR